MSESHSHENEFINKITKIVEINLSNEHFGVSGLAKELSMSRSNLHRKVIINAKITVSQFICQIRLKKAKEILRHTSFTVSEVAYKVGFANISYFIKRFHEFYGYPPGEVGDRTEGDHISVQANKIRLTKILTSTILVVFFAIVLFVLFKSYTSKQQTLEKSVGALPFENISNDSTINHFVFGLRENIISNLSKINDLRVVGTSSMDKYRDKPKPPYKEIAAESNINYIIEASCQKPKEEIYLDVKLIDVPNDKIIWQDNYREKPEEIISLQIKVAKDIADGIHAKITNEEQERINKKPTENIIANELYLKGKMISDNAKNRNDYFNAVEYFKKALEQDDEFALAYAELAYCYYQLDIRLSEKKFTLQILNNADFAILNDYQLDMSWIAKAYYYLNIDNYLEAIEFLEKALEFNPNSYRALRHLYACYGVIRDHEKSLKSALLAMRLNISLSDHPSSTVSVADTYNYLANALRISGFFELAKENYNKCHEIDPSHTNSLIYLAELNLDILVSSGQYGDYLNVKNLTIEILKKDSINYLAINQLWKACYKMREYEEAYNHFKQWREMILGEEISNYNGMYSGRIAVIYSELGEVEKSVEQIKQYLSYAESQQEFRINRILCGVYSLTGDHKKALEHLRLDLNAAVNIKYAIIRNYMDDPVYDNIRKLPEFQKIISEMETRFWNNHKRIRKEFEKEELLNL
ncbi:MAG: helix-turn-helix domain-containing protein [Prolixibacteraceae bacterium]|jgi:TolB-like protein/AraC-like DNA-binding protein|nr:helix-turn-helix domain-containing protein [Prolixibacteraceae bacterium]MBT6998187.1 helix-turn-helix domain-containing protein [Prolixibacteraceae bacterium]MBT7397058.1 helix-turn-helix domain-containing protein [Prolixibacteraceae bacterium]